MSEGSGGGGGGDNDAFFKSIWFTIKRFRLHRVLHEDRKDLVGNRCTRKTFIKVVNRIFRCRS